MRKATAQVISKEKRGEVVHVYLTVDEKTLIEKRARRRGLSMAAYLRALALEDASKDELK